MWLCTCVCVGEIRVTKCKSIHQRGHRKILFFLPMQQQPHLHSLRLPFHFGLICIYILQCGNWFFSILSLLRIVPRFRSLLRLSSRGRPPLLTSTDRPKRPLCCDLLWKRKRKTIQKRIARIHVRRRVIAEHKSVAFTTRLTFERNDLSTIECDETRSAISAPK